MESTVALKDAGLFQKVMKKGNWYSGDLITAYVLKNDKPLNLLGIAVGKKFSKASVRRNRAKRVIREAYRLNEASLEIGYLIVIVLKNNAIYDSITFDNVSADLMKCLKKANMLKKEDELDV